MLDKISFTDQLLTSEEHQREWLGLKKYDDTWPTKYTRPDIPPSEYQIEVHFIFQRSDNKNAVY